MRDASRFRVFTYVNAEKSALYRAIMRVFLQAKAQFRLHLRPVDVVAALSAEVSPERADGGAIEAAMAQLRDWGNLEAHPDTGDVSTVEEFYRPRFLFQLTSEGEAAERALALYDETLATPGELQTAALDDIRTALREIAELAPEQPIDDAKVHRALVALCARFDELTTRAHRFMSSLQRTMDLHGIAEDAFLTYKDTLIRYLEKFLHELLILAPEIVAALDRLDAIGVTPLIEAAARRDTIDKLGATEADVATATELWRGRWAGLRAWFVGAEAAPSQADVLRARARAAIPALLGALAAINERRVTRSDRAADYIALARWFAQADTEADAHRLWRAAFSLSPSRHLRVDQATLEERAARPVAPSTSWLDAPPLRLTPRLRATGRHARRGPPNAVVDRTRDKAVLAAIASAESEQLAAAQRRFVMGRPTRLSDLGDLDILEFQQLLDLLGEALAQKGSEDEVVETISLDGAFMVTLAPTRDGASATIKTTEGTLSGPDHVLTVRERFSGSSKRPLSEDGASASTPDSRSTEAGK